MPKKSYAARGTNEWKLFKYLQTHFEIMDLPKLISDLIKSGYSFEKTRCSRKDSFGNVKQWVEYRLKEEVELVNG